VETLFVHRGLLLAVPALLAVLTGEPTARSLGASLALLLGGLMIRAWATAHLGGAGRTTDPSPPKDRVVSGPYARLRHPLYAANLAVALGLVLALRPPVPIMVLLVLTVTGFYASLAEREDAQIAMLPARPMASPLPWSAVARHERSTWLAVAGILAVAAL